MSSEAGDYNEALKPLAWLFGKWASKNGKGYYPTINDFCYAEEAEFSPIGKKPVIEYKLYASNPTNNSPMHRETGFIKLQPDTKAVVVEAAHINGIAEILEGKLDDQKLTVETTFMGRSPYNKPPVTKKVQRTFTFKDDRLEQVLNMETDKTPMTEHLRITYDKVH